jgi:RNA polymerase sigma-70 factor, ECF subfamily
VIDTMTSMNRLSNEHMLVAQAAINPGAFAALYDHYFPRVYTYVRYRVESDAAADDLTAHIFERALARLAEYDAGRAPFGVWLFGIARYAVSNHRRGLWRWLPFDALKQRPTPHPSPEDAAIQHEAETHLLRAVSSLKDRERDLIALKYAAGMNNREIATLTGIGESNVGVILHRALKSLRAALGEGELL